MMTDTAALGATAGEQDRRIATVVARERTRLLNFIRRRVPDPLDAEDVLQDVFYKLVEANRRLMPIDEITHWLFRVARNRIIDLFRKKRHERLDGGMVTQDLDSRELEDWLPAPDAGPDAVYDRQLLFEELTSAIEALPADQRAVFIAHELDGRSFKDIAAETGVGINTLLSRKHQAVLRLRRQLRQIYDELPD
jgi:RNA polymerase sigma factor (sigma-70 family)